MRNDLTRRELEVLDLAADGLTNEEIATRLAISRRTVETHLRAVFHKTGATRRAQLPALSQGHDAKRSVAQPDADAAEPGTAVGADPAAARGRLQLYETAVRGLVDRQFPLFEERVEITVTVGERDGLDTIVERRWTTPKPYLVYRILSPIVTWTGTPADPDELAIGCDVHGGDIRADVHFLQDADIQPMVMVLFQPGLQSGTEWTLRYRTPGLWDPLRRSGQDSLTWATATFDRRHRPTINDLTLRVSFPATWTGAELTEQHDQGDTEAERLATGQTQVSWHARDPIAASYEWQLRGRQEG